MWPLAAGYIRQEGSGGIPSGAPASNFHSDSKLVSFWDGGRGEHLEQLGELGATDAGGTIPLAGELHWKLFPAALRATEHWLARCLRLLRLPGAASTQEKKAEQQDPPQLRSISQADRQSGGSNADSLQCSCYHANALIICMYVLVFLSLMDSAGCKRTLHLPDVLCARGGK